MDRSSNVGAFVKNGTHRGFVEITLQGYPSTGDFTIRRTISLIDTKTKSSRTTWSLNDEQVTVDVIKKLMEQLSIQMNNPCMFLPQERIGGFVKQTHKELLISAMRGLGGTFVSQYEELIASKKKLDASSGVLDRLAANLADAQREAVRLEKYKAEAAELAKAKRLIEVMSMKEPAAEAAGIRSDLDALQATLVTKRAKLDAVADNEAARNAAAAAEAVFRTAEAAAEAASKAKKKLLKEMVDINMVLRSTQTDIDDAREEITRAKEGGHAYEQAVIAAKVKVSKAEKEVAKLSEGKTATELEQAIREARCAIPASNSRFTAAVDAKKKAEEDLKAASTELVNAEADFARVKNIAGKRLDAMGKMRFQPAQVAIHARKWIDTERAAGRLAGEVDGPLCLFMNAKPEAGPYAAQQLENTIPAWVRFGFTVSDIRDRNLLSAKKFALPTGKDGYITVFHIRSEDIQAQLSSSAKRAVPPAVLANLSTALECPVRTAADIIEAPPHVMAVLSRECFLGDQVYADGPHATMRFMQQMHETSRRGAGPLLPERSTFATHDAVLRFMKSGYGGAASMSRTGLRDPEVLHISGNSGDTALAEQRLLRAREAVAAAEKVEAECKQVFAAEHAKRVAANATLDNLENLKKQRVGAAGKLASERKALAVAEQQLKQGVVQPAVIAEKLSQLRDAQLARAAHLGRLPSLVNAVVEAQVREWMAALSADAAKAEARVARQAAENADRTRKELKVEVIAAEKAVVDATAKLTKKQKEAALMAAIVATKHSDLAEDFAALPNDLSELHALIQLKKHDVSLINVDEHFIRQYDAAMATQKKLSQDEATLRRERDIMHDLYTKGLDSWQEKLAEQIEMLDKRFMTGMQRVRCRGRVELVQSVDDVNAVRLLVKVEFRKDAGLTVLQESYHSGGEKAVATMMFLLAMQNVTPLPFRVLDEINQGMDIKFERSVMEELMDGLVTDISRAGIAPEARTAEMVASASGSSSTGSTILGTATAVLKPSAASNVASAAVPPGLPVTGRQLFIISPKLLPNLKHHPALRTLIVYNGPGVGATPADFRAISESFTAVDFIDIARNVKKLSIPNLRKDPLIADLWAAPSKPEQPPSGAASIAGSGNGSGAGPSSSAAASHLGTSAIPRKRPNANGAASADAQVLSSAAQGTAANGRKRLRRSVEGVGPASDEDPESE